MADRITKLEKKATKELKGVTSLIDSLRTARENAQSTKEDTEAEIENLNAIKIKCVETIKFVDSILKKV